MHRLCLSWCLLSFLSRVSFSLLGKNERHARTNTQAHTVCRARDDLTHTHTHTHVSSRCRVSRDRIRATSFAPTSALSHTHRRTMHHTASALRHPDGAPEESHRKPTDVQHKQRCAARARSYAQNRRRNKETPLSSRRFSSTSAPPLSVDAPVGLSPSTPEYTEIMRRGVRPKRQPSARRVPSGEESRIHGGEGAGKRGIEARERECGSRSPVRRVLASDAERRQLFTAERRSAHDRARRTERPTAPLGGGERARSETALAALTDDL